MMFDDLNAAIVDTFGEEVEVVWLDTPDRMRNGIFDSRHYAADPGGEIGISSLETTLATVDDADDPIAIGETMTIRGDTWKIVDQRPDGQGMTVQVLEAVTA